MVLLNPSDVGIVTYRLWDCVDFLSLLGLLVMKSEGLCSSNSSFIPSTVPGLTSFFFNENFFFFLMKIYWWRKSGKYICLYLYFGGLWELWSGSLCTSPRSGSSCAVVAYKPACLNPASDPSLSLAPVSVWVSSFLRLVPVSVFAHCGKAMKIS